MEPTSLLIFAGALFVAAGSPGPSIAALVARVISKGFRDVLPFLAAMWIGEAIWLSLAVFGLAFVAQTFHLAFVVVKYLGVAYLVYLGVSYWRAPPADLTRMAPERKSPRAMVVRALLVSLCNLKTLLFYGAFFPQFLSGGPDVGMEIAVLSATFLVLAVLVDGGWALLAARARRFLASLGRLRNRLSGGLLIGAGIGLALARKS